MRDHLLVRDQSREPDLTGWVLRGAVTGFFLLMGAEKFSSSPGGQWVALFQQIGFGQWFRYFTGVVEVGGGLLYFFPRTCRIGAVMLACTMIGAMIVHIVVRHSVGSSLYPAVLLFAVIAIATRRPE